MQQRRATLIVDRDYRKVLSQSDRALVLQKGQVVLAGSADEVAGSSALAGYLGRVDVSQRRVQPTPCCTRYQHGSGRMLRSE